MPRITIAGTHSGCGKTRIPVLGYLPRKAEYALESRHLGLIPGEEIPDLNLT